MLAAVKRERHGRTVARFEARTDPAPTPDEAPFLERLARAEGAVGRLLVVEAEGLEIGIGIDLRPAAPQVGLFGSVVKHRQVRLSRMPRN